MTTIDVENYSLTDRSGKDAWGAGAVTRRTALATVAVSGATLTLGHHADAAAPPDKRSRATAPDSAVQAILDTALTAERLAITFYYTALTTHAVLRDARLTGPSVDPFNPGQLPGGNPANVKDLQAALDAELRHAEALAAAGARSPHTAFYFPAGTFDGLGEIWRPNTVLGRIDILETAMVGAYASATYQLMLLGRPDLAPIVARIMGVEAEHRVLGRLIAGADPVRGLATELTPIGTVTDAARALRPFVTGREGEGFSGRPTRPIPLPSTARVARVVGQYRTRVVRGFLQGGGDV